MKKAMVVTIFGLLIASQSMASSYQYYGKEFPENQLTQCRVEAGTVATNFSQTGASVISQSCRQSSFPGRPITYRVYVETVDAPDLQKLSLDYDNSGSCEQGLNGFRSEATALNLNTIASYCQVYTDRTQLVADIVQNDAFKELTLRELNQNPSFRTVDACQQYLGNLIGTMSTKGYRSLLAGCRTSFGSTSPKLLVNLKKYETLVSYIGHNLPTAAECASSLPLVKEYFERNGITVFNGYCRSSSETENRIILNLTDLIIFNRFNETTSSGFQTSDACYRALELTKTRLENNGNKVIDDFCEPGTWTGYQFKVAYLSKPRN